MQAYKIQVDKLKARKTTYIIDFYINKKNCETFCHTATLLIHTLKYLDSVSNCFTKEKKEGRVWKDFPVDKGLRLMHVVSEFIKEAVWKDFPVDKGLRPSVIAYLYWLMVWKDFPVDKGLRQVLVDVSLDRSVWKDFPVDKGLRLDQELKKLTNQKSEKTSL